MVAIRAAASSDLEAINEIYNDAVVKTNATFDTVPKTMDERREWYAQHNTNLPILVVEENGVVIAWASLNRYDGRCSYETTSELSIYVAESHRGQGVGKRLLAAIVEAAKGTNLHTIIARITNDNAVSLRLHEHAGFRVVGVMREVGYKFNTLLDVCIMQRMLS